MSNVIEYSSVSILLQDLIRWLSFVTIICSFFWDRISPFLHPISNNHMNCILLSNHDRLFVFSLSVQWSHVVSRTHHALDNAKRFMVKYETLDKEDHKTRTHVLELILFTLYRWGVFLRWKCLVFTSYNLSAINETFKYYTFCVMGPHI